MLQRKVINLIGLGSLVVIGCAACMPADASTDTTSYDSVESTHQAVDEFLDCLEPAPEATRVYQGPDLLDTTSIKCTNTVETFHFASKESKQEVRALLTNAEGSLSFAEGANWFVVDYAETATAESATPADIAGLAEQLGAKYIETN